MIRVWRTQHIVPDGQGKTRQVVRGDLGNFPDGYWFEELPDAPGSEPGIDHILYYDPATEGFVWEAKERPLTDEEITAQKFPTIEQAIAELSILIAGGM